MKSLRPHRQFNFVGLWKYGFILSGILIALAAIGLVVSLVTTGSALTLGTEFSGGTSIQITNTGDITQDQVKDAFSSAADSLGRSRPSRPRPTRAATPASSSRRPTPSRPMPTRS